MNIWENQLFPTQWPPGSDFMILALSMPPRRWWWWIQLTSIRSHPIELNLIQSNLIQFNPIQFSPIQSNSIPFNPIQFNSIHFSRNRSNFIQFIQFNSIQCNVMPHDVDRCFGTKQLFGDLRSSHLIHWFIWTRFLPSERFGLGFSRARDSVAREMLARLLSFARFGLGFSRSRCLHWRQISFFPKQIHL